jgi:vacuolar-type H+-ATPase subunit H
MQGSNAVRSDIINEVLTVEDKAQKIISDAEHTARDYISDAQMQANALLRTRLREEREKNRALLEQAEQDVQLRLEQYEAELANSQMMDDLKMESILDTLVARICATDLEGLIS